MKLLLIDVNCKNSSTGKIVYDLFTEYRKKGFLAAVAYGRGKKIKEDCIFKFGIDLETIFHVLMNRLTGLHGVFSFFSTLKLKKIIKRFNPDIIHLHELHGYFINIISTLEFIKKRKIKIIWTFHCEYMYQAKGHVYSKIEDKSWSRKKEYPSSWFIDLSNYTVRRYKKVFSDFENLTIVAPSQWLISRIENSFLKNLNTVHIFNGIDQKIFRPTYDESVLKKYNIDSEKIIVLSVAPNILDSRKGGPEIIEIAKKVKNDKIMFIMIGTDKSEQKYSNLLYIKRTSNQKELAIFYSIADVFLILSKRETLPTTCLESLSCGTSIIGYNNGGIKETAPENCGFFVDSSEKYKIINLLNRIEKKVINQNDKNLCTKFAINKYSKEVMLANYMSLYIR